MNKQNHQAGWRFGCIQRGEAKELHDNSGCSDSTDHSPLNTLPNLMQPQSSIRSARPKIGHKLVNGALIPKWEYPSKVSTKIPANHLFKRKIFVCGLTKDADEQLLGNLFSQFGCVEAVEVIRHKQDQRFKGFGYITFSNSQTVQRVLASDPQLFLAGKQIFCAEYKPRLIELESQAFGATGCSEKIQEGSLMFLPNRPRVSQPVSDCTQRTGQFSRDERGDFVASTYRFNREEVRPFPPTSTFGQTVFRKYQARVVARQGL